MQPVRGRVPNFSLKPHPGFVFSFFFTLLVGGLVALALLSKEEGVGDYRQKAIFVMLVTGLLCFFQLILATSKLWFPHLWKRNSTHNRHKQHSAHHPTTRNSRSRKHHTSRSTSRNH